MEAENDHPTSLTDMDTQSQTKDVWKTVDELDITEETERIAQSIYEGLNDPVALILPTTTIQHCLNQLIDDLKDYMAHRKQTEAGTKEHKRAEDALISIYRNLMVYGLEMHYRTQNQQIHKRVRRKQNGSIILKDTRKTQPE